MNLPDTASALAALTQDLPAPAQAASADAAVQRFAALLSQALHEGRCERIMLAHHVGPEPHLQRIMARPIVLQGQPHLSLVYRYDTKDITKNLALAEGVSHLLNWCGMHGFRNAHLHTDAQEVQLAFSKKGKASVRVGPTAPHESGDAVLPTRHQAAPTTQNHNREKQRLLAQDRPFLHALGVTDAQGQIIPAMSRKWKQINKFIEVFASALAASPLAQAQQVHVVDFGSGKGYLTFAIHDWLRHTKGLDAQVTGVELRPDLVALCDGVIKRLGLQGMRYEQGDVRQYHPGALNVMIALHACDVATDHAIHLGVRAGADIILCSPCCHKQIRPQLLSPHPLRPILQHGIHLGQEAEMLTDGLRALLLDAAGYDTQVFEFISLEHTNKNKMILGVKRQQPRSPAEVLGQIADIKSFYSIQEHCLEALLRADGSLGA